MPNPINPKNPNRNPLDPTNNPTNPNKPPITPPANPKTDPIAAMDARLRPQLNPATDLEEMFFHEVVVATVLGNFLMNHIADDPAFERPATPRLIRLLHANQSRLRNNYDELHRLQLARRLQQRDPALAAEPLHLIVATHTTRSGLRAKPLLFPPPTGAPDTPDAASPHHPLEPHQPPTPAPRKTDAPGRNAPCPCGSGRKFKHCCLNNPSVPQAA